MLLSLGTQWVKSWDYSDKDVTAAPHFGICHGAWVILHAKRMQGKQEMTQPEFVLVTAGARGEEWPRPDSFPRSFTFRGALPAGGEALQWGAAGSEELCTKDWEPPGRALWQTLQLSREKLPKSDGKQGSSLAGSRQLIRKHLPC